ncbi:MAG TPA: PAS domain-containing protein, partial [Candidatus Acidoferrum sp.]|nr:PAS domain-containing protein [Candidatus Acidoferrum sp.]
MMEAAWREWSAVALDQVAVPLLTLDLGAVRSALRARSGAGPSLEAAELAELCDAVQLVAANAAALELFGAASASELRDNLELVLVPSARAEFGRLLAALGDASPSAASELVLGHLSGERIPVAVTCRADMKASGPPVTVVTIVDRRELGRAERELGELQARQRTLLDGIPDLVFDIGPDGAYRGFAGPREACSVPPAAFVGKPVDQVELPEIGRPTIEAIERVRRTGAPETVEYSLPVGGEIR